MTVAAENTPDTYTGDGANDTYQFTFRIFDATDLLVSTETSAGVRATLAEGTDYTVTGVDDPDGGDIVLTAGNLASGTLLSIRPNIPITQPIDLRNQGQFLPETLEDALDRLTMIAQQLDIVQDRCVKFSETYTGGASATLPDPEASKALMWNSAADALENVDPGSVALAVPGDETVTNPKLAHMAQGTIKGRQAAAGTGDAEDLTAAQARTILNVEDGAGARIGLGALDWATKVTINGAVALTTTAINKVHSVVDAGTPADYPITLDAAADYTAGDLVAFVVDKGATKIFTVTAVGSDTIGRHGDTARPMIAGTVLILESDGVDNWRIVEEQGNFVTAEYHLTSSTANATITNNTLEVLDYDSMVEDTHAAVTPGASWRFDAPISGWYQIHALIDGSIGTEAADGATIRFSYGLGGALEHLIARREFVEGGWTGASMGVSVFGSTCVFLSRGGDQLDIRIRENTGSDMTVPGSSGTDAPKVTISKIGE